MRYSEFGRSKSAMDHFRPSERGLPTVRCPLRAERERLVSTNELTRRAKTDVRATQQFRQSLAYALTFVGPAKQCMGTVMAGALALPEVRRLALVAKSRTRRRSRRRAGVHDLQPEPKRLAAIAPARQPIVGMKNLARRRIRTKPCRSRQTARPVARGRALCDTRQRLTVQEGPSRISQELNPGYACSGVCLNRGI